MITMTNVVIHNRKKTKNKFKERYLIMSNKTFEDSNSKKPNEIKKSLESAKPIYPEEEFDIFCYEGPKTKKKRQKRISTQKHQF